MSRLITRRTVLRGLGTALALPALDAFAGVGAAKSPVRMAFLMVPNGINMDHWVPQATGAAYELPSTLGPLKNVKDRLLVLSGLAHDKARANGDGPGDHARSSATFLTGCQARKTDGREIRAGISVDQVAAQKIGSQTRLPSLEIGCDRGAQSGNCDSGYSCAYSSNISWTSATTPLPKEVNPRLVFGRLFGDPDQASAARQVAYRKSVLDLVLEDAKSLGGELGGADRVKLDEYLESVRAVERQIQSAERENATRPAPKMEVPEGIPADYPRHVRLMMDLLALAFQADITRIVTFMYTNEGSNRSYPFIDVREGHHSLSHHGRNPEKLEKIRKIDQFHVEQFAYLLEKLKSIREGDGTLLDHSMIVYGGAIGDGNRHNHNELPILLAGKGGGSITPGRHVRYPKDTPACNLFLSMLDRVGVKEESLGDSTGRLPDLQT